MRQQPQAGFTLIELVIVIVLLGILAAVAVPKFIDLSADAKGAVLTQFQASVKGANKQMLVLSKMNSYRAQAVSGRDDLTDVDVDGDGTFETRLKCSNLDNTDVAKRLDYSDEQLNFYYEGAANTYFGYETGAAIKASNCYFLYRQANGTTTSCPAGAQASYQLVTSGC
ncbi:prepilin-type N-terminal cleavage/methylation domain-containing protein [uncultured Ferrimonas sp.]|uniref:pilin n=1 Tax=uncultured Ferrimonas sp. TaxID=432640 RepID=UPI002633A305|nr:prepilin-type N-terminal cleavage/methylation domain-containing protein [uncultured Ferrimonas sp.]